MNDTLPHFTQVMLETGPDGRARWRDEALPLSERLGPQVTGA